MHGRSHRVGGSDPIPGLGDGIRFDYDNQGGYLDITARSFVPDDSDTGLRITVLAEDGGAGDFLNSVEGTYRLTANLIVIDDDSGNQIQISSSGVLWSLQNGDTYVINDHLGSPLVTYTG